MLETNNNNDIKIENKIEHQIGYTHKQHTFVPSIHRKLFEKKRKNQWKSKARQHYKVWKSIKWHLLGTATTNFKCDNENIKTI